MAKVKQPFGEARYVPDVGRNVDSGEVFDVPDNDLPRLLEGGFEPADDKTRRAGKQLLDDGVITVLAGPKAKPTTDVKES